LPTNLRHVALARLELAPLAAPPAATWDRLRRGQGSNVIRSDIANDFLVFRYLLYHVASRYRESHNGGNSQNVDDGRAHDAALLIVVKTPNILDRNGLRSEY